MAEFTNAALQNVLAGQNVVFNETPICGKPAIIHREGSGIVRLRALTNNCRARFRIGFGANIAIPEGGTVEPISIAIAVEGEPLLTSTAIVTPAAAEDFWNVFVTALVDVERGCCATVSVENTSTQAIDVQNANLIVDRVA